MTLQEGCEFAWYDFKLTSADKMQMTSPGFCGVNAGPRTIFKVTVTEGYRISELSDEKDKAEVLLRPLTTLKVLSAVKNIIDPFEREEFLNSGFPDFVELQQLAEQEKARYEAPDEAALTGMLAETLGLEVHDVQKQLTDARGAESAKQYAHPLEDVPSSSVAPNLSATVTVKRDDGISSTMLRSERRADLASYNLCRDPFTRPSGGARPILTR